MDQFTPRQVFLIREAIYEGRMAMADGGADAMVFAMAFLDAGGLQVPGRELSDAERVRIHGHILESLGGTPTFLSEAEWVVPVVTREIERAFMESDLAASREKDEVVGFRLKVSARDAKDVFCRRITGADLYGLGAGVFPKEEIVVLPPHCESIHWEPVYAR